MLAALCACVIHLNWHLLYAFIRFNCCALFTPIEIWLGRSARSHSIGCVDEKTQIYMNILLVEGLKFIHSISFDWNCSIVIIVARKHVDWSREYARCATCFFERCAFEHLCLLLICNDNFSTHMHFPLKIKALCHKEARNFHEIKFSNFPIQSTICAHGKR